MSKGTIVGIDQVEPKTGYCGYFYELIKDHNSSARELSCVFVMVLPGARSTRHRHLSGEELYIVVSGRGTIHLDDISYGIGPNQAVFIPSGISHMIENTSSMPLNLFVVNAPPYDPEMVCFEGGSS